MTRFNSTPAYAANWALFLDVDGTLVEFAEHPDEVRLMPDTLRILEQLQHCLDGALALVSGRGIAALDQLFAPLRLPSAGLHGLERRDDSGELQRPPVSAEDLAPVRAAAEAFAAEHPALIVEDKEYALALHYRRQPELEPAVEALLERVLSETGDSPRLALQRGKMVMEVKPTLATKGSAIEAFMAQPPWAGRIPVFIGDDVTDEHGFAVVNTLRGHSIKVGQEETAAGCRLCDIHQVIGWLRGYVEYLELERHENCDRS